MNKAEQVGYYIGVLRELYKLQKDLEKNPGHIEHNLEQIHELAKGIIGFMKEHELSFEAKDRSYSIVDYQEWLKEVTQEDILGMIEIAGAKISH